MSELVGVAGAVALVVGGLALLRTGARRSSEPQKLARRHLSSSRPSWVRDRLVSQPARQLRALGEEWSTRAQEWLTDSGMAGVRWRDFIVACVATAAVAFGATWLIFGGPVPSLLVAGCVCTAPLALYRSRRTKRLAEAQEAWPRIIEEIRLSVTGIGTSIPAALFAAGARVPGVLREGFEAAERTWSITTDFAQALTELKERLRHPTADVVCETLLAAHDIGGVDLDRRLSDLAKDRLTDLGARKDARSKQAGARFARVFVLAVPVGMALMGLSIGRGRVAYQTTTGQILVAAGVLAVAVCWWWASRIMRVPSEKRVFAR